MYVLHNSQDSPFDIAMPLEAILERAIQTNGEEALRSLAIIVPTGRRVRLLQRAFVREIFRRTGKPVSEARVFTLESFTRQIASNPAILGAAAPHLASEALLAAIMEEAEEACRKDLEFFRSGGDRSHALSPAVLKRLHTIILGLKEDGVSAASLRNDLAATSGAAASAVTDPRRLGDIATLYESYERALLKANVADMPALLNRVVGFIAKNERGETRSESAAETLWRDALPELSTLVLDGFTEFKKPEEELLATLFYAPFHVRIIVDYSDKNGPLFGGLRQTVESLMGVGGGARKKELQESNDEDSPDALSLAPRYRAYVADAEQNERFQYKREEHLPRASYLRRWLFNTEEDIRHEGLDESTHIIAFERRADEARSIVKLLRYFAVRLGEPLSEMCVVMPQPELYTGLFREMFAAYAIPANITDRFPLEKSPVVTAVFAALDVALYGYRRDDVHRALQSPYLKFTQRKSGARLNAANLFTVSGRLRIRGGRRFGGDGSEQWRRRFAAWLEYLSKRSTELNAAANADPDEIAETRRFIEEIELAASDFDALAASLKEAGGMKTPLEFQEYIERDILQKLCVRDQIISFHRRITERENDDAPQREADRNDNDNARARGQGERLQREEEVERDARALAALVEILDETTAILHERDVREREELRGKVCAGEYGKDGGRKRPLEEYVERLRVAVRNARYQVREKIGYGVTVTSLEQIRNIPFRTTIICGLVDGEFPRRYVPESFLGKELQDSEERFLQKERVQFYQVLTNNPALLENGGKRLILTYPTLDDANEPHTRSPFVDALLKITNIEQAGHLHNAAHLRTEAARGNAPQMRAPEWLISSLHGLASHDEALRRGAQEFVQELRAAESAKEVNATKVSAVEANAFERLRAVIADARFVEATRRVERFLLSPPDWREARVRGEGLGKDAYSISALEKYASCPYRFFAGNMLRLREVQDFEGSLSPLESGSLLHKILWRFYRELQDEQRDTLAAAGEIIPPLLPDGAPEIIPVHLEAERKQEYRDKLRVIAREELAMIPFDHPFFALDQISLVGTEDKTNANYTPPGKLDLWLESELARVVGLDDQRPWDFAPALFEFAFGQPKSSMQSVRLSDDVSLRGKIDRIEILPKDDRAGGAPSYSILVGDYKSSVNVAHNADIRRGTSLQMPLYLIAAEKILQERYGIEAKASGAAYYILSPKAENNDKKRRPKTHSFVLLPKDSHLAPPNAKKISEFVENAEEMRAMIDNSVQKASAYARNIKRGFFPVKPQNVGGKRPCEYCSFQPICRIQEQASQGK